MTDEEKHNGIIKFKYNMSFYYQSTIIYFIVFMIYVIIRGEFVEDSFKLITRDPIIYFFAIIVMVSLLSLLYNLYKNRYLEVREDRISFVDRFKTKFFTLDQIADIKISRSRRKSKMGAFKLVRIKLKKRRRPVLIRPYDYENVEELISKLHEIKEKMEKK